MGPQNTGTPRAARGSSLLAALFWCILHWPDAPRRTQTGRFIALSGPAESSADRVKWRDTRLQDAQLNMP
jgi:hypothetical protein